VDPLRILIRVVFAYVLLLVLMRLSGKRTVKQANPFDFTIALIVGDLVDDVVWAEVNAAAFVIATGTLMLIHVTLDLFRYRGGLLQR
jgi:uncharacterized membrane protein YcaP (DUF421 family)